MTRRYDTIWNGGDDRFIEIMQTLTHPYERWTEPERPDILLTLDELIAWTNDGRSYDQRLHKSAWLSAITDFLSVAETLGPALTQVVKPNVDAVRQFSSNDAWGDPSTRAQLITETTTIRQALGSAEALTAAWHDLLKACRREDSTIDKVAIRRDTFWAVVHAADRNAVELGSNLRSVLNGSERLAQFGILQAGIVSHINGDLSTLGDEPVIHPAERLRLAEAILKAAPQATSHVVWFAFRHAHLDSMSQQFPSFQFFDAQWLRGNLDDGPHKDQLPSELRNHFEPSSIPDESDVVMARVDLGTGAFSDAVRIAAERLDTLLGMSTIGRIAPWERIPGFIHVQGNGATSEQYFEYTQPQYESRNAWQATATQINRMAPRVAPLIPIDDPDMRDIVDALHWWRTAPGRPTAASVVLDVRVIELIASRIGETSWTAYLEKYAKNLWIREAITDAVHLPVFKALHRRVTPEHKARQREIRTEVTLFKDGEQLFDTCTAVSYLSEITRFFPSNLALSRDLRTIGRKTANSAAMSNWCSDLERQWQGWVHRLERVRNSITHGGPFTESAVRLIQPFSQRLSVSMLWACVDGYLRGRSAVQTHTDLKNRWDQWRKTVADFTSIDDIFDS